MKNLYILFLIFTFQISILHAQDCNIGNTNDAVLQDMSANFLLGNKHYLSENGVLQSINLIGNYTGANVQMAIYADNSGAPGSLVVAANAGPVVGGTVTFPVTPIQLYPGYYWIMAVYSSNGDSTFGSGNTVTYFQSFTYGNPMPSNMSSASSYDGYELTYFLEITCGSLDIDDNEQEQILIYPNPNQGLVNIDLGSLQNASIKVINIIGQVMYAKEHIDSANHQFEFNEAAGIYFVEVTSKEGKQIVKLIKE